MTSQEYIGMIAVAEAASVRTLTAAQPKKLSLAHTVHACRGVALLLIFNCYLCAVVLACHGAYSCKK